jgi:hypothetical protein
VYKVVRCCGFKGMILYRLLVTVICILSEDVAIGLDLGTRIHSLLEPIWRLFRVRAMPVQLIMTLQSTLPEVNVNCLSGD